MSKKEYLKKVVGLGEKIGVLDLYTALRSCIAPRQTRILAYHRIDWLTNYPWGELPVTPDEFEAQINYIVEHYKVISLEELYISIQQKRKLPHNAVVITIDDGYKDIYTNAYPILKKYNIPATVFLATGSIGTGKLWWWDKVRYVIWKTKRTSIEFNELGSFRLDTDTARQETADFITKKLKESMTVRRDLMIDHLLSLCQVQIPHDIGNSFILSWDEIREMAHNGIQFGAHSINHPILTRIPLIEAENEIKESKRQIEQELDQEIFTFCYPNGEPDDFSPEIETILKRNGFSCAVTLVPSGFASSSSELYRLPRISGADKFDMFRLLMSGLYLDIMSLKRNVGRVL